MKNETFDLGQKTKTDSWYRRAAKIERNHLISAGKVPTSVTPIVKGGAKS